MTRTRTRPAVLIAVALVTGLPAVPATHVPGQDDAGTGQDAGDTGALATEIEPGSYTGELAAGADTVDVYALDTGSAEILRVSFSSPNGLDVSLVDPNGTVRDANDWPGETELSATARPAGQWQVRFELADRTSLDTDVPYSFELRLEEHEGIARLEAPEGPVPTLRAEATGQPFVRLELDAAPEREEGLDAEAAVREIRLVRSDGSASEFTSTIIAGDVGNPQVRSEGSLPPDVHVDRSLPGDPAGIFLGTLTFESTDEAYTLLHGVAWSRGVQQSGWLVWDGEPPNVEWLEGGTAAFLEADDMNATGPTTRAGPYLASEGLTAEVELPEGSITVGTDAHTPDLHREALDLQIRRPDGVVLQPPDDFRVYFGGEEPLPGGPWNVTIDHVDGLEHSRLRFFGVSFPYPAFSEIPHEGS